MEAFELIAQLREISPTMKVRVMLPSGVVHEIVGVHFQQVESVDDETMRQSAGSGEMCVVLATQ